MTLASCGRAHRLLCRRQKQAIIQVVDEMIETTKALSAKTDAEWMDMLREMYPGITKVLRRIVSSMYGGNVLSVEDGDMPEAEFSRLFSAAKYKENIKL